MLISQELVFLIKLTSKHNPIVCALKNYNLNLRENWNLDRDLNLGLTDLNKPGTLPCSIDGTGLNFPLESNAMQFFS